MLTFVLLLFGSALCLSVTLYLSLRLDQHHQQQQQQQIRPSISSTSTATDTPLSTLSSSSTSSSSPSSSSSSQSIIMVLAMHHSGTSLLTRILIEMGLFGGARSDFKLQTAAQHHNRLEPPKYWERLDVIAATEQLINRTSHPSVLARDRQVGWLTGFAFRATRVSRVHASEYADRIRSTVDLLRVNRSSDQSLVLKEPRLSLTWPFWRPVLLAASLRPVCVILYRHPLLVAAGLRWRPRNRAMLLEDWLALWEKYTVGTLRACHGLPKVLVSHDALARSPATTVDEMFRELTAPRRARPSAGAVRLARHISAAVQRHAAESLRSTIRSRYVSGALAVVQSGDAVRDSDEFLDGDIDVMAERELVDDDAAGNADTKGV
jgi:hypothetical protein